jgi:phage gp36-like protein
MPYAVQADLSPRRISNSELIQLTDDTNSGAVNAQLVTDILDEASALIDSYVRVRYNLPLQASSQVKGLCLTIGEYLLYLRRKRVKTDVRQAYVDALAFLKDVSTSKAGLDQPVSATPQSGGGDVQVTQIQERFSEGSLGGFLPDPNNPNGSGSIF